MPTLAAAPSKVWTPEAGSVVSAPEEDALLAEAPGAPSVEELLFVEAALPAAEGPVEQLQVLALVPLPAG